MTQVSYFQALDKPDYTTNSIFHLKTFSRNKSFLIVSVSRDNYAFLSLVAVSTGCSFSPYANTFALRVSCDATGSGSIQIR